MLKCGVGILFYAERAEAGMEVRVEHVTARYIHLCGYPLIEGLLAL
jgi:hypothetical protein